MIEFQDHIILSSLYCLIESESFGYYVHLHENWRSNIVNIFLSEGSASFFDVLMNVIFFIFRDKVLKIFFLIIIYYL